MAATARLPFTNVRRVVRFVMACLPEFFCLCGGTLDRIAEHHQGGRARSSPPRSPTARRAPAARAHSRALHRSYTRLIFRSMRPPYLSPIVRLRPTGDPAPGEPPGMPPRPRGSRRPHTDEKVARVRHLIEQTTLTYGEIAARTGVGRASICRWTVDGAWKRPLFAPRATDTIPRARASHKLRRRTLAARLTAL